MDSTQVREGILRMAEGVQARIDAEGGATYFDMDLLARVERLGLTEDLHGWDPAAPTASAFAGELKHFSALVSLWSKPRYVSHTAREKEDAVFQDGRRNGVIRLTQGARQCFTWKGLRAYKSAFDLAIYQMLISELRPATILEIGSGDGGSAAWLADMASLLAPGASVFSFDKRPVSLSHPGVRYLVADAYDPPSLFRDLNPADLPHPWLVVEDAHQNIPALLVHIDAHMKGGDYIVVEDNSGTKIPEVKLFLNSVKSTYFVDTKYVDFFSYNMTSAANSILMRGR
jgi:cephalosporin hydroxylase